MINDIKGITTRNFWRVVDHNFSEVTCNINDFEVV